MKHQDEFRDRELAQGLATSIAKLASLLHKPVSLMEVCGTHTMSIARFGLKSLLPQNIRLVSGPGCPVCVTPASYIDQAVALSRLPETVIATFGDLIRVPGSSGSLSVEKGLGADIRIVYSPLDALKIAAETPHKQVIFLGVGFETTAPAVGSTILTAHSQQIENFSVLAAHKTMPAPMAVLSSDPALQINGYLCPAHVSTVIGGCAYAPLADKYRIPCVVTGFEPADILQGIQMLIKQHLDGVAKVEIQYKRAVKWNGNTKALGIIEQVFQPASVVWRGLGTIIDSGLEIREKFSHLDAARRFNVTMPLPVEPSGCRCGEVLTGRIQPSGCPLYGAACTPETPVGACMVSSEGSCAASWKYGT